MIIEKKIIIKLIKPFIIKVARPSLEEIVVDEVILQEPLLSQHKLMSKCNFYYQKALMESFKNINSENRNEVNDSKKEEKNITKYINGEKLPVDDEELNAEINSINFIISTGISEKDIENFDESMKSLLTVKSNSVSKVKERCVLLINDELGLESNDFDKLSFQDYQRIKSLYFMVFFAL